MRVSHLQRQNCFFVVIGNRNPKIIKPLFRLPVAPGVSRIVSPVYPILTNLKQSKKGHKTTELRPTVDLIKLLGHSLIFFL